jgi:hypothetical protein
MIKRALKLRNAIDLLEFLLPRGLAEPASRQLPFRGNAEADGETDADDAAEAYDDADDEADADDAAEAYGGADGEILSILSILSAIFVMFVRKAVHTPFSG